MPEDAVSSAAPKIDSIVNSPDTHATQTAGITAPARITPTAGAVFAEPLQPADVVGCRHRAVLRRRENHLRAKAVATQSSTVEGIARIAEPADDEAPTSQIVEDVNQDSTGQVAVPSVPSIRMTTRMTTREDLDNQVIHAGYRITADARKLSVFARLPRAPRIGDKLKPTRVDILPGPTAVEDTLEAMASGARLITGAHLEEGALASQVDLLVRRDNGYGADPSLSYAPVVISGHAVARKSKSTQRSDCSVVDLGGLGLSAGVPVPYRHRAVAGEAQKLAMAHVVLESWGFASGDVGLIGHADAHAERCYFFPGDLLKTGLMTALSEPVPSEPMRVRECAACEFHNHCRAQLLDTLDISLLLPGDRNRTLREEGIDTLPELAAANRGELSAVAQAWLEGETALRRPLKRWITDRELWGGHEFRMPERGQTPMVGELRDVIDIDVDMEAHPQRGTFLWGTFDGNRYIAFEDFSSDGDEGAHVAEFWAWLHARRAAAERAGQRLRVWVYAAQGENHWLRHYARNFGGRVYGLPDGRQVTMPTLAEVNAFIDSDAWSDAFRIVRQALAGTGSLGLKTVAPLAGFQFSQEGVDGRAAVELFEQAIGPDRGAGLAAQRTLERYNADDCVATSHVRAWLRAGAPGIPSV